MSIRVGLNLLYLLPGHVGGTETYGVSLCDALARSFPWAAFSIFINLESGSLPLPRSPNVRIVQCPVRARHRAARHLFEQIHLPRLARELNLDLLHSLGYTGPLTCPCPSIVTVHDAHAKRTSSTAKRLARLILETLSARRAHTVIVPSRFSRQDIARELGVPPKKIFVVYEAPKSVGRTAPAWNCRDVLQEYQIRKPYLVAFSSLSPHKNLSRLMRAFEVVANSCEHNLVLVGHGASASVAGLSGSAAATRVTALGYVPDDRIPAILSGADLLVFPSLYEGFGLPVVEAQMYGVPVVCSNAASLPEIAGGGALYFDPLSTGDIAAKTVECINNPALREKLRREGSVNVTRFSWEKAAHDTMSVYLRVLRSQHVEPTDWSTEQVGLPCNDRLG